MKPITIGFCADACPLSPNAAAPAALPSNERRPNLNLSIMFAPSPEAFGGPETRLGSGQQALCQRFLARILVGMPGILAAHCMQSGAIACFLGVGTHFVCKRWHAVRQ